MTNIIDWQERALMVETALVDLLDNGVSERDIQRSTGLGDQRCGEILSLFKSIVTGSEHTSEAARWKEIALFLADVQAATAEQEAEIKSVSKSRKRRHLDICGKAVSMIEGTSTPPFRLSRTTTDVLNRLRLAQTKGNTALP